MKVFHATPHEFDFPDYGKIRQNMSGHANGMLGLWVGVANDWIRGFGSNVYEVVLSDPLVEDLSISRLTAWAIEGHEFHQKRRQEYLERGVDFVRLVEKDGRSDMGIVINFDAIASFHKLDEPPSRPRPRAAP